MFITQMHSFSMNQPEVSPFSNGIAEKPFPLALVLTGNRSQVEAKPVKELTCVLP